MLPTFGPWELIVILLIVVVIFGAGRLSEVGGAVGKSIREFRKATTDEAQNAAAANPPAVAAAPPAQPLAAGPATPVVTTTAAPVAATTTTAAPVVAAPATPAKLTVTENKCPSCATVNPDTQVFCGQCGTRLTPRAA